MDPNARDFERLARGKKQYNIENQPTGHIDLFRNDVNTSRWVAANGGIADVSAGGADPTGFSESTFLSSNYTLLHRINSQYAPQEYSYSSALTGGFYDARKEQDRQKQLQRGCVNSNSCAAGYSCISGQCTKIWGSDPSNVNSCGEISVEWPCASAENTGTEDCGNSNGPGSCQEQICGTGVDSRCCRQGGEGKVFCFCRKCGDEGQCDPFCDAYQKTNGEAGPGCTPANGVHAGFCNKDICSECQTCTSSIFGGGKRCREATSGVPCWCEGAQCDAGGCEKCNKDPESPGYGDCEYSQEGCADCCTVGNYLCSCGAVIPSLTHCEPHTSGVRQSCFSGLRNKAAEICEEACATEPDPCAPTGSITRCVDGSAPVDPLTNPGGPEGISCPEGKTCEYAGYMEVNGKTCYFYNTWVTENIPPECKECDCNCNNDCKDCEICNAQGECVRDPNCCDSAEDQRVLYELTTEYPNASNYSGFSGCNQFGPVSARSTFCATGGDAYELKATTEVTATYNSRPSDAVRNCAGATGFSFPGSTSSYPLDYSTTVYRLYKNGELCSPTVCPGIGAFSFEVDYARITASYPTTWNFRSGGVAQLRLLDVACNQCPPDPGA